MASSSHFQAAPLVDSPSYPNSVAWSDENLVAVAAGHLITILNPASLNGPRGLIMIPPHKPFPIGVVKREDLLTGCLLPTCLSRDTRPCARSISWSHVGLSPNSGCLLAVCTIEGRVKLYRPPFSEFCAEWIEVADISDLLLDHLTCINFGEVDVPFTKPISMNITRDSSKEKDLNQRKASIALEHEMVEGDPSGKYFPCARKEQAADDQRESVSLRNMQYSVSSRGRKRKMACKLIDALNLEEELGYDENKEDSIDHAPQKEKQFNSCTEIVTFPNSNSKKDSSVEVVETENGNFRRNSSHQRVSGLKSGKKSLKQPIETDTLPLITARQYASRNAILSSTVVSWSPVLQLSYRSDTSNPDNSSSNCCLLGVGGKSGKISFWRIHEPQCYSVEHGNVSVGVTLVGLLQAHNSWITAICWEIFVDGGSSSQLLLTTGSSDGSVKIWRGDAEGLSSALKIDCAFSLLKEVTNVTPIPVSVLSSTVPAGLPGKMLLAIGRGSGSFDVWICDICHGKLQSAGSYEGHYQVVTGLSWAFNGCSLYSCSQDNTIGCWILNESTLSKVAIPPNSLGLWSSGDVPDVSDSCFGLAISPGNLVLAVARGFDTDLLNQMYQARTQKAAVEFFWIGGQQLDPSSETNLELGLETYPGFSLSELAWWQSNLLWSLKQYEDVNKQLVAWDVIAALSAFNRCVPTYVQHILGRWLSGWFVGCDVASSVESILRHASECLSKIHSRQLHLLNIICRRLVLSDDKTDIYDDNHHYVDNEQLGLWVNILVSSERELRERLVALNFAAVLRQTASANAPKGRNWLPVGIAQMEQWVALNSDKIQCQLKVLASESKKLGRRLHSIYEYVDEEKCRFCSAPVLFETPEVASCVGVKHNSEVVQRHKLSRCAVSMQVCPTTTIWYCVCCHRWVSKLPPEMLFTMSDFISDINSLIESSSLHVLSTPLCPFCGILLQRFQPEFLLSVLPV